MAINERAERLRNAASERLYSVRSRWPPVEFLIEGLRRFVDANGTILAGHLAFRVFVFLVPLYLVFIAVLGFAASTDIDTTAENFRLSSALRQAMVQAGADASGSRVQAALVGGFAMLVAGVGLASALRSVYGVIWNVKPSRSALGRLAIMGAIIVVVLAQAIGSAVRMVLDGPAGFGVGAVVVWLVAAAAVLLVSWLLPRRTSRWRDLLVGAAIGGAGFAGLNIATVVYFAGRLERSSQVYGSLGVAVTVLFYLFVVGQILVISGIANTLWVDRATVLSQARGETAPTRSVGSL